MTNIHQRYRSLFNNELLGVYCSTPGGTYQTVNETFARIFGYDSAQQLLSEVRDIARQLYVDPEDRTRTRDLVLASGCCTVEVQARRRDGSLLWIRNHTWIVRDRTTSDGPPVSAHPNRCPIPYDPGSSHFEGFIQDITAQKMAAEELRVCQEELEARASNSEAQFRKIFMKVPAVVTLSRVRDGRYVEVNEAFCKLSGYSRNEVIGRDAYEVGILDPKQLGSLRYALERGEPIEEEVIPYRTRTGEERRGLYSTDTIVFEGEPCIMGILQDITDKLLYEMELKQREQVLAGTAERLEEANIALRTLLEVFNKEKEQLANQVTASVRDNLAPYIERLKSLHPSGPSRVFLEMMESSLCHLLAPYASGLGILSGKLSQREKEVAMMVKQGKLSKEIAQTLGVDVTTVNTQRNSIRKKLGLSKNRKLRLRDYLNAQPE